LGRFFGSKGLSVEEAIENRIWGEQPEVIDLGLETHIPYLLNWAYQKYILNKILSLIHKRPDYETF